MKSTLLACAASVLSFALVSCPQSTNPVPSDRQDGVVPVLAPAPGSFVIPIASGSAARKLDVSISAPAGSVLRYTTDGSDPTVASPLYGGPISLVSDTTVKARYWLDGQVSDAVSAPYVLRYQFFALDMTSGYTVYSAYARRRVSGDHSVFYVEEGQTVSDAFLSDCAAAFESMYTLISTDFANPSDVDGDGKIILLILDIKDGATATSGYVAGYFDSYDCLNYSDSNKADMLYMDWNPGSQYPDGFVSTMIHELQHLANFNNSFLEEGGNNQDTWVNEGLSTAAEYLYAGAHLVDRIDYYNKQPEYNGGYDTIAYGEGFVAWGTHLPASDVLAAYSTVYLFMQWLRIHDPAGAGVYKEIIDSAYYDYRAVVQAASDWSTSPDWTTLIRSWYLANYLDQSGSFYGYEGELTGPLSLTPRALSTQTGASLYLYPGEGVYVMKSADYSPTSTDLVLYAGFNNAPAPAIDLVAPLSGSLLLAYNSNGDENGTAIPTAPLPVVSVTLVSARSMFSVASVPNLRRFRIDALDPRSTRYRSSGIFDLSARAEYGLLSDEFFVCE